MLTALKRTAIAVVALAAFAAPAAAFHGEWEYRKVDDQTILILGDRNDGQGLHLYGTDASCGGRGAPYARIRNALDNQGHSVNWYIANDCGNLVRICISNKYGQRPCSTYLNGGWHPYYRQN